MFGLKYEFEKKLNFPTDLLIKGNIEFVEKYIIVTGKYKRKKIISMETGMRSPEYRFVKFVNKDSFIVRLWPQDISDEDKKMANRGYDIRKYSILSMETGKKTEVYDFIHYLYDDIFMVGLNQTLGIVSSRGEVLCPIEYMCLTFSVDGYVFAIKEVVGTEKTHDITSQTADDILLFLKKIENPTPTQYDILLYDLKGRLPSPLTAAYHTTIDLIKEIKNGMFLITINNNSSGLKSISVPNPGIFDEDFVQLINSEPSKSKYDNKQPRYWIDGRNALSGLEYKRKVNGKWMHYDNNGDELYEEPEETWSGYAGSEYSMEDTWNAVTDGAYGDMPDGWDGDLEFMGH